MRVRAVELSAKILLTFVLDDKVPETQDESAVQAHLEETVATSTVADVFEVGAHKPDAVQWRFVGRSDYQQLVADGCATSPAFIGLM